MSEYDNKSEGKWPGKSEGAVQEWRNKSDMRCTNSSSFKHFRLMFIIAQSRKGDDTAWFVTWYLHLKYPL